MKALRGLGPLAAVLALLLAAACATSPTPNPATPDEAEPEELRPAPGGDDGRVFHPQGSIACDRATQTCYVDRRPDVAATERYLGERAARCLEKGGSSC